jgi:hypothetical protein
MLKSSINYIIVVAVAVVVVVAVVVFCIVAFGETKS